MALSGAATAQAMIGRQFGKLIVIEVGRGTGKDSSHYYCFCICDCGREIVTRRDALQKRSKDGCGCMESGYRKPHVITGESRTRLYAIWSGMLSRCYNTKDDHYPYYGGKGKFVYEEWKDSFLAFKEWSTANGYSEDLTLDRIDGHVGYSPDNCRWTTVEVQNSNKINHTHLMAFGTTKTLAEWAKDSRCKVTQSQLRVRTNQLGWNVELAMTTPLIEKYSHKETI